MAEPMERKVRRAIILASLAVVLLGFSSHIRVVYLAALVLAESATPLVDGPIADRRPDPVIEAVSFSSGEKTLVADLYRPAWGGTHPGIVLNHGVAEDGRRDRRLVNFADALARAGFVALVPEYTNLKAFRVRLTDVDEIVASFEYLEQSPHVRSDRIGLFGFSYAGGLSLLAIADARIADRAAFCFSLGGYYDLEHVVTYMTTGMFRVDEEWVYLEPRNSGRWAFLLNGADLIGNPSDRAVLERMARLKLDHPGADVSAFESLLGDEGLEVYRLMVNDDADLVGSIVERLNDRIRRYLVELSPKGNMNGARAHLILGHGRDDNMIPYTETLLLAEHTPPGASVHVELLDSFKHVDLKIGGGRSISEAAATVGEVFRLFSITYDLLSQGLL